MKQDKAKKQRQIYPFAIRCFKHGSWIWLILVLCVEEQPWRGLSSRKEPVFGGEVGPAGMGSAAGSVTDSVYAALLVVYRTVDAWWWLLTVPSSRAERVSALFRRFDGKLRADRESSVCWLQWSLTPVSDEELGGEWTVFYLDWKSDCGFWRLSFGTQTLLVCQGR